MAEKNNKARQKTKLTQTCRGTGHAMDSRKDRVARDQVVETEHHGSRQEMVGANGGCKIESVPVGKRSS